MKVYKFRSINEFEFIVDILLNNRLHCCEVNKFNDITEGDFRNGDDRGREVEFATKEICYFQNLHQLKVCSLSKTFNNQLLWAYYANGFNGVAIEIEIPDDSKDVFEVKYSDDYLFFDEIIKFESDDLNYYSQPLCRKKIKWSHEEEIRIIINKEYYQLERPISKVIYGSRVNNNMTKILQLICSDKKIALGRAIIADWGIYTV